MTVSLVHLMEACLLVGDFVYLSCLLFGMRLPALVFVDIWVELGFRVEMGTSWRALANEYSPGPEILLLSSIFDLVLPPQRLRPDPHLGNQDSASCMM